MLPSEMQRALDVSVERLKASLGENLYALILYGSAVRGNVVPGVSDLNLLLILEESTPEAHDAIADGIKSSVKIEPFILGRSGLERSFQAFAVKFRSIQRHYQLLHGADPFATFKTNDAVLRFLCEQSARSSRLRLIHAYVTMRDDSPRYQRYVLGIIPGLVTNLSDALRYMGAEVPVEFSKRIGVFQSTFNVDASVLDTLLKIRQAPRKMSAAELSSMHSQLHGLLNQAIAWMELQWPRQEPGTSG